MSIVDLSLVRDIQMPSSQQPNVGGGTPLSLAPQVLSDSALSQAADWYGVGAMIYELLTGRLPFAGSWLQVLPAKYDHAAVLPDDFDRQEPLAMLCADLLQRNPDARPTGVEIRERFARLV